MAKPGHPDDGSTIESVVSERVKSQMEAIINGMIGMLNKHLKSIGSDSFAAAKKTSADITKLEKSLSEYRIDLYTSETGIKKKAAEIYRAYEKKRLAEASALEQNLIYDNQIARLKAFKEEFEEKKLNANKLADIEAEIQAKLYRMRSGPEKDQLKKDLASVRAQKKQSEEYIKNHKESYEHADSDILKNLQKKTDNILGTEGSTKEDKESLLKELKSAAKNIKSGSDEEKKNNEDIYRLERSIKKDEVKEKAAEAKAKNDAIKAELKYRLTTLDGIKDTIGDAMKAGIGALSKAFDALEQPINSFYEYQAKYEARMQGSENQYNKMMSNIGFSIGLSPFIKQQKMVENLQRLIDTGTNYNLELRAYIATVSENIASTFDAFDGNLMRLIRIQQSDSTAARMGMEAALTKILNSRFSDSSYLSGTSDTVAGNLLDASAQLSHQMATEFEFVTQKWLGALYSLGVGDQTITNIAQGLGYLGSGNIDALAGNDQLMSLLAMSASRGGASISDFLTGNLTASNTEKLLRGMVELLGDIANNTDSNKVTRAAFANVFGITNTDLRSISNLTQSDIDYLSGTNLNYSQALVESSNQLKQISSRMHISNMISNLMDNATVSSALMIGGNAATYTLYKALNVVSSLVGDRGLEIPGIQALGTGTASGIDVLSVAKAAVAGGGLLASLIGSLGNLGSGGLPALDRWAGYEKSLQRGEGLILKDYGVQSGFSESAQYNNTSNQSSDDMTKSAMQSSKESATENMSEEDKASQDEAKEYQSIMRNNLQSIKDNMDKLLSSNRSDNLSVYISNDIFSGKTLDVNLNNLSDSAEIKFKNALAALIVGNIIDEGNQNNSSSLVELIKSALNGANVHIDNDYFDDFYQKQFTNMGGI